MADSSFSMVFISFAACGVSCKRDADKIESKEAGFTVLEPEDISPGLVDATGALFFAGGVVLPPQYKRAINIIATAMAIYCTLRKV